MSRRRGYLDWLRGVGVLIMIGSHTLDSWTRVEERAQPIYGWSMVIGGFGAPIFLFLAGTALVLAANSRLAQGATPADVAAMARRRAWQIFALAFVFRLQSWAISEGPFERAILKVDILNVIGLSMLLAALIWGIGRNRMQRAALLAATAIAVAMVTPLVRATPLLDVLPDPVEWYLRPSTGRTNFTMLPWSGFLIAGAALGELLAAATSPHAEKRLNVALLAAGPAIAIAAYAASHLPPLYAETSFWTSSPTFFFVRLGILLAALPLAFAWNAASRGGSPLVEFGMASLFVYWIHVEMVYGVVSMPLHRRLTFGQALVASAIFTAFLFLLVRLKGRLSGRSTKQGSAAQRFSPCAKRLTSLRPPNCLMFGRLNR